MRNFTTVVLLLLLGMGYTAHAQINSFPYNQDFESLSQGPTGCQGTQVLLPDWMNVTGDDGDWVADINGTGSSNTGPTANGGADHNPGVAGGIYLYQEASGCAVDTANLVSANIETDPTAPNLFFNFWYHQYGQQINVLYVQTRLITGGTPGPWVPVDTLFTPPPGLDIWQEAQYDMSAFIGDTFQIRLRGVTGTSFGSDMALDDFSLFSLFQNDAGVTSIDNPTNPVTTGPNNIDVTIENFGADSLRNATIGWSFNGVVQTPFSWTGGPLGNGQSAGPITIGNFNVPPGLHQICAWTTMPNMMVDSNAVNDTTCFSVCTPLSGVYTLGGPGADFADFTEAGSILSSCGISANTTVNVAPGTYMEEFILDHVPGTGPNATLTINGGDTSLVFLNGASGPTVYLDGTDYTTVKNMTISAAGTIDAYGVQLRDTAEFNTIDSCRILMNLGTNTSDCIGVSASGSITSSFTEAQNALWTTVSNCHIVGGEKGIHFEGQNALRTMGNSFINNWIDQAEDYGFYIDDQDSLLILRNRITNLRNTNADAIYCFDIQMFNISENMAMDVPDYGLYIADGNFAADGTPTSRGLVINNMISSTTDWAAYFDDFELADVWHNTFGNTSTISGGIRINDFTGLDIQNNIFYSSGDYAFESDDAMTSTPNVVDYNAYYTLDTARYLKDGPALYTSLAGWQLGEPTLNVNSVAGDPVFINGISDMHILGPLVNDIGNNLLNINIDVDGDARPQTPSTVVDIGADEFTPLANDAVALVLLEPGGVSCGDSNTAIIMVISNYGQTPITTLPITVDVSGDIMQTVSLNYTGNLGFNQKDTVIVGTINTYGGANVNMTGWVSLTGDQDTSNDSLGTSSHVFVPGVPQTTGGVGCGVDSAYFYGVDWPGAGYSWFANMTDTTPIATGDSFLVPSIMAQSTYYVQYANNSDSLETTYAGGNGCGGGNVFDVTTVNSIQLTGVSVNTSVAQGQTFQVTVHITSPGGSGIVPAANATNAANFPTSVGPFTGTSAGAGNPSYVDFGGMNLNLNGGTTYGMYVEFPANYTNGVMTFSNADMTIQTGIGLCGSFSGPNNPRSFNGALHYGTTACSNIRVPVTAYTAPAVSVNIGNDTTLCANAFALDAGNPGMNYDWSNGDTTQVSNVTMSGLYSVLVTDTSGCDDSDTIDLTLNSIPAVNLGPDILLCDGASDTLDAGNPGASYMWSTAGTGQLEVINMAGTVSVQVTDSNSCVGTDTVIVTTGQTPASVFTFTVGGAGLAYTFTDASTGTPSTYSWNFGDGNTSTAQNPMHTYAMPGSYTVTLTVTNDCGTNVSTQSVTVVSIEQSLGGGVVSLYPNPNNGQFKVEFNGLQAFDVNMRILNVKGQVVLERKINEQGNFVQEVDITRFAKGMYLMQLTADGEQILQRVIVE